MGKLAIFDLDGTVLDTLFDLTDAVNVTLREYGYREITTSEMRQAVGGSTVEMLKVVIGDNVDDCLFKEMTEFYIKTYVGSGSPKTMVFRGLREVLYELKTRGFKLVILTNKPANEVASFKERLLDSLAFDKVVGLNDEIIPKPDATETLKLMKEFNASPEETYFIGDGETDMLTAVNAKVHAVGVSWGNRDKEVLFSCGAEKVADSPVDLVDIIK